jgi:phosphoglycerate dehydrogenase-like enzyme
MLHATYLLDPAAFDITYGPEERQAIAELVNVRDEPIHHDRIRQDGASLREASVVLSGAGCPKFDASLLDAMPGLQIVFFGKGSIRGVVTDEFWERGVRIVGGWAAMAVPVAEYALSQILFCLKRGWQHAFASKNAHRQARTTDVPGAYGSVVGVVSLGMIGRTLCELLKHFDLKVLAFDPFASPEAFRMLGAEPCSLEDIFRRSDVVTLHTPLLPETTGLVTGAHIASMKRNATLINTSRGAIIREPEMLAVLQQRPDLFAVLDVTDPEPALPESPLFTLPNVVVTPHIAGPLNTEYRRVGRAMVEELRRFVNGEPLRYEITRERASTLA